MQINAFVIGQHFAGLLVTRLDAAANMNIDSECTRLRVVDDGSGVALPTVNSVMDSAAQRGVHGACNSCSTKRSFEQDLLDFYTRVSREDIS